MFRSTSNESRDPLALRRIFSSRSRIRSLLPQEKPMKYTLLTCGLLMATSAFADPGVSGDADRHRTLDADGDRLISLPEAQAGAPELASRFSKIDANQD